jgi:lysophospholipase L1-like esterase
MSNERAINSKYANNVNVSAFNLNNNYNKIKITVEKKDSSDIFNLLGIYLDNKDEKGIVYNSLGVGGSSLYSITDHNSLLVDNISNYGPDLIILSFGSNDAYYKNFDNNNYKLKLVEFIKNISSKNPNTTFLLTSPPDSRSKNREPVSLPAIQQIFSEIAETRNNVAYWDLRSIMGGENSVNNWLKNKLAENDKLHYTKAGYDLQAQLLIKALLKY